jgi:chromosome partition protein MukB
MTRARASALALVNWRGVFFERYFLDQHVTALEGANGAGKTTVMIAAYVVLLPDLTRLKFTNLGETGATGGDRGIYGRLGEPGPSYAALEIQLDGNERLIAAVYLERKAAPALSLTPFIISALPAGVAAQHIFLRQSESHEHVATMADIEARAAELEARLEVFDSAKEYFAALFERGVSPLRLALDEERNKYNDMLRTSMTGGISRTLTSELRSFLFKQQSGLFDTLARMRRNLDACRRTRVEVSEARVLEQEINGIYTAGHAMFSAALEACRTQAAEQRAAADGAEQRLERERALLEELGTRAREAESRQHGLAPRLERARSAEATSRERLAHATRALAANERLTRIEAERRRILPAVEAARDAQLRAASARERAKARCEAARETQLRAAGGLASLQAGLDELHREAHAHRQVRTELARARSNLVMVLASEERAPTLEPDARAWLETLAGALGSFAETGAPGSDAEARRSAADRASPPARAELGPLLEEAATPAGAIAPERLGEAGVRIRDTTLQLDRRRAERDREARVAERRLRDHAAARAALAELAGEPPAASSEALSADVGAAGSSTNVAASAIDDAASGHPPTLLVRPDPPSELVQRARRELTRLNELELLGERQSELGEEWQRLKRLAERQRALREEVRELGLAEGLDARAFMHELATLDAAWLDASEQQREHEAAAERLAEREAQTRETARALAARQETQRRLAAIMERRAARGLPGLGTRAELNTALRASHEARGAFASRSAELEQERLKALARARQGEGFGAGASTELARLAELAEGQLLAGRYEELELDEARRVQAELGPLANAIVVDDLERAIDVLSREPMEHGELWVLQAGADWTMAPFGSASVRIVPIAPERRVPDTDGNSHRGAAPGRPAPGREPAVPSQAALVDIGHGVRLTRLPRDVNLGRSGRRRQAERARAEADAAGQALAALELERREQEELSRELESLQEHWDCWALGDPGPDAVRLAEELARLGAERQERLGQSRAARVEIARLGARRDALRAQLANHHLLDPPEYAKEAERARLAFERSKGAALELERGREARRTLTQLMHELAEGPPNGAALERWQRERAELDAQRDRLFATAEALAVVASQRAALDWTHAERALAERTELVPELEAQHEQALAELGAAQRALEAADASWEQATAASQSANAELMAVDAHLTRARVELGAEGVSESPADACAAARIELEQQTARVEQLQREHSAIGGELLIARERQGQAEERCRAAALDADRLRREAEPSDAAWRSLETAARAAAVFDPDTALTESASGDAARAEPSTSARRWLEAESRRDLLSDRLRMARGGAELAAALKARLGDGRALARDGREHLAAWLEVRGWLLRRLPPQIAELGQPLLGLARLRRDLGELEARLGHQEGELRGTSGDVARSIDVQLRRAGAQVKRLNRALDGVRFGSIQGIRVQLDRLEKMDQVLLALREGETQELLFQSNLPIEEAMDEIFRRHAGGRTGGQRLLDYREYIELSVQIQRRAEQGWERVNPSQVSTGEAIGIGAALMMVILAEWERDDQLLRQKRGFGSLRFLFLDEANRLSQDNLGTLFDLCEVLDLQLLIAAPEVARAHGNTTYRLVRRVADDGREEVLVTGRRATLPGENERVADGDVPSIGDGDQVVAIAPEQDAPLPGAELADESNAAHASLGGEQLGLLS